MAEVQGFKFSDFTNGIKNFIGKAYENKVEENKQSLQSIFDEVAKNDKGKSDILYEADTKSFQTLVQKGVSWIKELLRKELEEEGDELLDNPQESFEDFRQKAHEDFNKSRPVAKSSFSTVRNKAVATGNYVSVMNNDGTSYRVNLKEHTIDKYSADDNLLESRSMSEEERRLSTNDLINRLKNAPAAKTEKTTESQKKPSAESRQVKGKGIFGSYSITDDGNGGYKVSKNFVIKSDNQALEAFRKGLTSDLGVIKLKPDASGQLNFRGIRAATYSTLSSIASQQGKVVAENTAIYLDLKAKESGGEALTSGEQRFLQDYQKMLSASGLQINANGELEDIPEKRGRNK